MFLIGSLGFLHRCFRFVTIIYEVT